MCGIVGFVGPGDRDDLHRMMDAVAHRGPDGAGMFNDPKLRLWLGHRRLSVVDIADGAQPMWNGQLELSVVFNGEIYNHRELRRELEAKGYRFKTDHSDTEVLLHGYAQWGDELPLHLNGMFAFCIFDRLRGRLFLARDRFGEKPLYYCQRGELFAFGSELSAVAAHPDAPTGVSRTGLQKLLAYGFLPPPHTILEGVRKLDDGCSLTFDLRTSRLSIKRYWRFRLDTHVDWLERTDNDVAEELRSLLQCSVEKRLAADVPVGFFLSGGLDSSAMLALAARLRPVDTLQSFTLGFVEPSYDESRFAEAVANHLGVRNSVRQLDLDIARDAIPDVLSRLDEPSGDPSILPTYLLSQFTREHVTVAITGDGGDELFAGYDPFAALNLARFYKSAVPRPLHALISQAVHLMPRSGRNMSLDFKLRRTLGGLDHDAALWNPVWLAPVDPALMKDLFEEPLAAEELYSEALDIWEAGSDRPLIDQTLQFYTNLYLPNGILTKVDRASMLNSLETRAPFLDNAVVDFCQKLPHEFKRRSGRRKHILKEALTGLLPRRIIDRKKKGFGIPAAQWLRSTPANPPLTPVPGVRMPSVRKAWADHRAGKADHRLLLWSWLSLQSMASPPARVDADQSPQLALRSVGL